MGAGAGDISELLGKHGLAIDNDGKIETCKGAQKKCRADAFPASCR